jgi:hypothetical protein
MAAENSELSLEVLVERSDTQHRAAIFAPTGGSRVQPDQLLALQKAVRAAASLAGYPERSTQVSRSKFDTETAGLLHKKMNVSPAEASSQGVWAFIACVLLPDVVRWRFPGGDATTQERFLGGVRGIRNTYGRLWWRAHVLQMPDSPDPLRLIRELGEDELVQITERPNLAGSMMTARLTAQTFLEIIPDLPQEISRSDLLRDAMKRLRRMLPLMTFDALDEDMLQIQLEEVFRESLRHLAPP